jgi:hypothetical protein
MLLYPGESYVRNISCLASISRLVGTSFGIISPIVVRHQFFTVRSAAGSSSSLLSVLCLQCLGRVGSITNTSASTPADLENTN